MEYPQIKPTEKPIEKITPEIKSTEPQPKTNEPIELPPSLSKPYIIKLLDIGEAEKHFEMPRLISEINDFVLSEIKRNHLKDSSEVYQKIVDKYKIPDTNIYTKIEYLNEAMMIDKKLIEAMIAKEELRKKPIEELTSYQLRKRIEENATNN